MTRGERNIVWMERYCHIPEGTDVGKPMRFRPWQRRIVLRMYDTPTRTMIVSFGRKNGKTALAALLTILHLCGPESRPHSQLYSAAQSKEQAAILFELAAKMVRMSPDLDRVLKISDSRKWITCPGRGTVYKALSADVPTSYGKSPVFVVHDELGQVKGPRSDLYDALESGSAAHADPLSLIISTQAPTDADLLSVLIDDALTLGATDTSTEIKVELFTAPMDADPFSEAAIIAANPAYGDFQNAVETRKSANDAKRMPSRQASFRNLNLNQRVEARSPFVSRDVWKLNGGDVITDFTGRKVFGGLDLAETSDLTALVLITWEDDCWHIKPTFWLPREGIIEKSRQDRVPYDNWADRGFLELTPGRSVDYEFVAKFMRDIFDDMDVEAIAFDRYLMKHLKPWLEQAGFNEAELERFIEFGQGYQMQSPALRDLESDLLNARMRHGMHPVLTMCAANAVVKPDPAGNRKLDKEKSRGRIDGMVALNMARGVAGTVEPVERSIYEIAELWDS